MITLVSIKYQIKKMCKNNMTKWKIPEKHMA